MRVLLVTHYYSDHRGGIEIAAEQLAKYLQSNGVEITWAASGPRPGELPAGISPIPMTAWNFTEKWLGFPYPLWGPFSLARLIRAVWCCDLLHLHDCLYFGNVVAFVCALFFGIPVIVTQHIGPVPYSNRVLRTLLAIGNRTLGRIVLGGCTQCVFISRKVQDYFGSFVRFRPPSLLIPNGVSSDTFHPIDDDQRRHLRARFGWSEDKCVILFVGRFVEKKGLPILHSLAKQFSACEWVFIGWGPDDPRAWNLSNVHCVGSLPQREIADYYRAADLLILLSVGEGFPLVVQEALACGTPVMISDDTACGMPDIGNVAWVTSLHEAVVANLIRDLLASPKRLEERRGLAAEYARRRWDSDVCFGQNLRLFEVVTKKSKTLL